MLLTSIKMILGITFSKFMGNLGIVFTELQFPATITKINCCVLYLKVDKINEMKKFTMAARNPLT